MIYAVTKARLLLVSTDYRLINLMKIHLEAKGYIIVAARSIDETIAIVKGEDTIDLVILDIQVQPEILVKVKFCGSPVIMITDDIKKYNAVIGYDVAADKYMVKPVKMNSLIKSVEEVLLKNKHCWKQDELDIGGVYINKALRVVRVDGEDIYLTQKQFDLLAYLMENDSITLSINAIAENVWRYNFFCDKQMISEHIIALRKKLNPHGSCIKTIRNVGYQFIVQKNEN